MSRPKSMHKSKSAAFFLRGVCGGPLSMGLRCAAALPRAIAWPNRGFGRVAGVSWLNLLWWRLVSLLRVGVVLRFGQLVVVYGSPCDGQRVSLPGAGWQMCVAHLREAQRVVWPGAGWIRLVLRRRSNFCEREPSLARLPRARCTAAVFLRCASWGPEGQAPGVRGASRPHVLLVFVRPGVAS